MANNNKLNWLDEVKADARHITLKRIRDAEEAKAYEESKKNIGKVQENSEPAPGEGFNYEPDTNKKGNKK